MTPQNSIRATLEFSFQGKNHRLESILDLDSLAKKYQHTPPLHRLLADQHQINSYSYQYEMLEQEEILFDQPTGAAVNFLDETEFDFVAYFQYAAKTAPDLALQEIAKRELSIDDLAQHPQIKNALLQAYQEGLST